MNHRQPSSPRLIHVWVPELVVHPGGIQTFSRFLVRAVREIFPHAAVEVFAKHDPPITLATGAFRIPGVQVAGLGRWPTALRTAAFSARAGAAAIRRRPDLILTTHVHLAALARWIGRFLPIPYIPVAHGIDVWGDGHRPLGPVLNGSRRVLAVSHFTRDQLVDGGMSPEQVLIQPNTYDGDRFTPRPASERLRHRFGLGSAEPVIVTVCRLANRDRYKGYDEILGVLPSLRRRFPGLRYLLGGSGPDRSRLESMIHGLGLQKAVILAGFVQDEDLPAFYSLADVFAMPSKGEGFGIVFLEAMACGKPVIAGNRDGSVDALLGGRLGRLVNPDAPEELESALAEALHGRAQSGSSLAMEHLSRRVHEAYGYPAFRQRLAENLAAAIGIHHGDASWKS